MLKDYDYYSLYDDVCKIMTELCEITDDSKEEYFDKNNKKIQKIIEIFKDDLNDDEILEDEDITDILVNILNVLGEKDFVISLCKKIGLDEDETDSLIGYSNDRKDKDDLLKCLSFYVERSYGLYENWEEEYGEEDKTPSYTDPYKEIGMHRSDFF